ncbi:MAG: 50S ribosomal protein L9 [Rickettsiales bacterium]|nr:50S ribosomal protein L9 [Rickettsiales bacterium]
MEIILLESFDKLGKIGDVVKVKDGFARNFLLPQKKALRANKTNKEYYEKIKNDLEENNKKLVEDANSISEKLKKVDTIFLRQASETGQLYGSVTPKDISNFLSKKNINVLPSNINLTTPIKNIGIFEIIVKLHADVIVNITINVATSEEKALEQKKEKLEKKKNSSDFSIENLESSDKDIQKKEAKKNNKSNVKITGEKKIKIKDSTKETDKEK